MVIVASITVFPTHTPQSSGPFCVLSRDVRLALQLPVERLSFGLLQFRILLLQRLNLLVSHLDPLVPTQDLVCLGCVLQFEISDLAALASGLELEFCEAGGELDDEFGVKLWLAVVGFGSLSSGFGLLLLAIGLLSMDVGLLSTDSGFLSLRCVTQGVMTVVEATVEVESRSVMIDDLRATIWLRFMRAIRRDGSGALLLLL